MDIVAAYEQVGTFRGAAALCGTTHKTVKRVVAAHRPAGRRIGLDDRVGPAEHRRGPRRDRGEGAGDRWADLGEAAAADRPGGRLHGVGEELPAGGGRGEGGVAAPAAGVPAVGQPTPGEHLVIDWATEGGWQMFCAVLAWSRWRFVRFARDQKAATTMRLLAECFEELGGVPRSCWLTGWAVSKGGVVANVMVPTPDYVRFATHFGFRPDFCEAADPESKGVVEALVPLRPRRPGRPGRPLGERDRSERRVPGVVRRGQRPPALDDGRRPRRNGWSRSAGCCGRCRRCGHRCAGVRPQGRQALDGADRLGPLLGPAGAPRPRRRGDRHGRRGARIEHAGEVVARHPLVAPGEVSIIDEHYGGPRRGPARAVRARSGSERAFLALGPAAERFLRDAAAAGTTKLGTELAADRRPRSGVGT